MLEQNPTVNTVSREIVVSEVANMISVQSINNSNFLLPPQRLNRWTPASLLMTR